MVFCGIMNALARRLLAWYDRSRRDLPWRAAPGERADLYRIWLSEIMLQQTGVVTVIPYFQEFTRRWPSVEALAAADLDDVLRAWAGLGYYARARNLHACAVRVATGFGGRFPADEAGLLRLPGIGPYSAAAIAAIAFGRKATVVDGNVERVMARLAGVQEPLPGAKPRLKALVAELVPDERPGDFAQAMMDLGATICRPGQPLCSNCPWSGECAGERLGIAADLPARAPKRARPTRQGVAFWLERADGAILFRRRPPRGLLGGMMEVPSTPWREEAWDTAEALTHAPWPAEWSPVAGGIGHTFTHFHLELSLLRALVPQESVPNGMWIGREDFSALALPTLMQKLCRHALEAEPLKLPALSRRRGVRT